MKINRIPYEGEYVNITQGEYGTYSHKNRPVIDLVGSDKTIVSPCNGYVRVAVNTNSKKGWGTYLSLQDEDNKVRVILCHLQYNSIKVVKGQRVRIGQRIAIEGATGDVQGRHLHMEIRNNSGIGYKSVCSYTGLPNRVGKYKVSNYTKEIYPTYETKVNLNMRQSVGTASKIIQTLPKGVRFSVYEFYQGDKWLWGKTTYKGKTGWLALTGNTIKR